MFCSQTYLLGIVGALLNTLLEYLFLFIKKMRDINSMNKKEFKNYVNDNGFFTKTICEIVESNQINASFL